MLKITKNHIEIFRQYLLSNSEEIRINMLRLIPGMFLKYMTVIEDSFLHNRNIEQTAQSIDATHLLHEIKQLQIEYYLSLAKLHLNGETNPAIKSLLDNNNVLFKNVIDYQFDHDLKQAFVLTERANLKKQFAILEMEDIANEELQQSFLLMERKRLKQQFKQLDSSSIGMVAEPTVSYNIKELVNNEPLVKPSIVRKINWKRIAIAASIVGIICTTTLLILKNNNNQNKLARVNREIKIDKDLSTLSNTELSFTKFKKNVLKESTLGFAAIEEIVSVKVFNLSNDAINNEYEFSY